MATKKKRPTSKQKIPKNRKKRINIQRLLIVILGFAIIIAAAVALLSIVFATPETKVKKAYVKTMKQLEKDPEFLGDIIDDNIKELVQSNSSKQELKLDINETNYNSSLNGVGFDTVINKDAKKTVGSMDTSVSYKGSPIFNVYGYTDNKQLLINVPQLYSKVFSMESNNIMKQYSSSVLGSDIEYTDLQDFSVSVFNDNNGIEAVNVFSDFKEEFYQIYNNEIEKLAEKVTYEKLPEKKEISINGQAKTCRGYKITAESTDVKSFVTNLLTEVRTSKKIRSLVEEYSRIQYEANPLYLWMFENPNYITDNYYKQLDEILANVAEAEFTDTTANVYIYKGVIASFGIRSNYSRGDENFIIQLLGGMYGGKTPWEDMSFTVNLQNDERIVQFSFKKDTDKVDSVTKNKTVYTLGDSKNDLVLDMSYDYDNKSGKLNGKASLTTPDGNYIMIDGSGNAVKDKKSVTITADNINIDYNKIYSAKLSGMYSAEPLKDKVEKPEGETVEIFKLDKNGIDGVKKEIKEKLSLMTSNLPKPTEETTVEESTVAEST